MTKLGNEQHMVYFFMFTVPQIMAQMIFQIAARLHLLVLLNLITFCNSDP